jgi:SAM-dependent methyltransferase
MNIQEQYYLPHVDYRIGSPHLSHPRLYDRLTTVLRVMVQRLADQGLPLRVLEVGAGHGGFTELALAMGCEVTAVDMSKHSVGELQRRFGTNRKFRAVYDPDGTLRGVDDDYSLVMFVSVLHHVPDYVSFVKMACERITSGGALLALQDPLHYSGHRMAHRVDQAAYLAWRVSQGNLSKGIKTRLRRIRGVLDEANPADMVEYHVVRDGVDEEQILAFANTAFKEASLLTYWSNQLGLAQYLGDKIGLRNYFGIIANGYEPGPMLKRLPNGTATGTAVGSPGDAIQLMRP